MTQNTDNHHLIALSKSCSQISNQLSKLIASQTESLSPSQTNIHIKNSKDLSSYEYLSKSIQNLPVPKVYNQSQRYCLQQDIFIILSLSQYTQVNDDNLYQIINKRKINRRITVLRIRAKYLVSMIKESQVQKIVKWVQTNGVNGYLTFQNKKIKFSLMDPTDKIKKFQQHDKLKRRSTSLENSYSDQQPKKKKKRLTTICGDLTDILSEYSKANDISSCKLLQLLHKTSGDFILVYKYLQTNDFNILWNQEEDSNIRKCQQFSNFRGLRTQQQVQNRKKYLGIL